MSTKLKYILQSNVFGLEKYKEAKNSKKKLKLCRAFYVGARQRERKKLPAPLGANGFPSVSTWGRRTLG
jgi:hypothetical protein